MALPGVALAGVALAGVALAGVALPGVAGGWRCRGTAPTAIPRPPERHRQPRPSEHRTPVALIDLSNGAGSAVAAAEILDGVYVRRVARACDLADHLGAAAHEVAGAFVAVER